MQGIPFTTNEFGNLNCDMLVNWNEIQKFDEFVVINNKIYANNSFDLIECRLNTIETLDKIERTWCCLKKV